MSKMTVKMLMEQIFYRIYQSYTVIGVYDAEPTEDGFLNWVKIDEISALIYFTSHYASKKQQAQAHKYDDLEADWYISIPHSPADVSEVKLSLYLMEPLIKTRNSPAKKETSDGE